MKLEKQIKEPEFFAHNFNYIWTNFPNEYGTIFHKFDLDLQSIKPRDFHDCLMMG